MFGFRHDLTREAIEGRLLGREHRRIHEAALEALRRHRQLRPRRRWPATPTGPAASTSWSTWPARGAEHYQAIGSSYQALGLAELGLSEADGDMDLRSAAARAAWLAGLHDDAIEHARRLEADADRAGDVERRAEARRLLVRLYWEHGLDDERTADDRRARGRPRRARRHPRARAGARRCWPRRRCSTTASTRPSSGPSGPSRRPSATTCPPSGSPPSSRRAARSINRRELIEENIDLLLQVADEADAIGEDLIASRAWHNVAFQAEGRLTTAERLELFERMRAAAGRAGLGQAVERRLHRGPHRAGLGRGRHGRGAALDRRGPPASTGPAPRGAGPTSAPSSSTSSGASPTSPPRWPTTSRT